MAFDAGGTRGRSRVRRSTPVSASPVSISAPPGVNGRNLSGAFSSPLGVNFNIGRAPVLAGRQGLGRRRPLL